MIQARKLSFQEAWQSTTVFLVDDDLEAEIDDRVDDLLHLTGVANSAFPVTMTTDMLASFIAQSVDALNVIIYDIGLSEEKLLRIISLLRIIGRIPGGFDREWSIDRIRTKIAHDAGFAHLIASLLMDGSRDPELARYIPRYYLETLNYRDIQQGSYTARRIRYKRALIGTYGGRKGYTVENRIRQQLERIQKTHGIGFGKGRSRLINTDIDFAVPHVDDPWVIIMSSFQETTSSGQSTKARDMLAAYQTVQQVNSRHGESRACVNFVDGGGWLARRRDFQRLSEHCDYFVNLQHLDMLEAIVLQHVPRRYWRR